MIPLQELGSNVQLGCLELHEARYYGQLRESDVKVIIDYQVFEAQFLPRDGDCWPLVADLSNSMTELGHANITLEVNGGIVSSGLLEIINADENLLPDGIVTGQIDLTRVIQGGYC